MAPDLSATFEQLYADHQAKVYRLAMGLAGNADDAEEITQEAFYRAFRSYQNFRGVSSFFTWIYRITLNVAHDYLKQRTKMPREVLTEDLGLPLAAIVDLNPGSDPEAEVLAREVRLRCLHCLTECLPMQQRQVFCLAITLGLPQKLVAEILECSPGAVKTILYRAKQRWIGYMENRCQLIKKTNPCNCRQWIRFAKAQGWISAQTARSLRPPLAGAKEEILKMGTIRDLYQELYNDRADTAFVARIRDGIRNKEWAIFS